MVSYLIFRYLNHFQLCGCLAFPISFAESTAFLTVYSYLLCHISRLVDCRFVGLFWTLYSVPLKCMSVCANIKLFLMTIAPVVIVPV